MGICFCPQKPSWDRPLQKSWEAARHFCAQGCSRAQPPCPLQHNWQTLTLEPKSCCGHAHIPLPPPQHCKEMIRSCQSGKEKMPARGLHSCKNKSELNISPVRKQQLCPFQHTHIEHTEPRNAHSAAAIPCFLGQIGGVDPEGPACLPPSPPSRLGRQLHHPAWAGKSTQFSRQAEGRTFFLSARPGERLWRALNNYDCLNEPPKVLGLRFVFASPLGDPDSWSHPTAAPGTLLCQLTFPSLGSNIWILK